MRSESDDSARRERASLRAAMPGEIVQSGTAKPNLYAQLSPIERFAYMSELCRTQWEASGRVIAQTPRSKWPGQIFEIGRE